MLRLPPRRLGQLGGHNPLRPGQDLEKPNRERHGPRLLRPYRSGDHTPEIPLPHRSRTHVVNPTRRSQRSSDRSPRIPGVNRRDPPVPRPEIRRPAPFRAITNPSSQRIIPMHVGDPQPHSDPPIHRKPRRGLMSKERRPRRANRIHRGLLIQLPIPAIGVDENNPLLNQDSDIRSQSSSHDSLAARNPDPPVLGPTRRPDQLQPHRNRSRQVDHRVMPVHRLGQRLHVKDVADHRGRTELLHRHSTRSVARQAGHPMPRSEKMGQSGTPEHSSRTDHENSHRSHLPPRRDEARSKRQSAMVRHRHKPVSPYGNPCPPREDHSCGNDSSMSSVKISNRPRPLRFA
jgi:hypothetical protein